MPGKRKPAKRTGKTGYPKLRGRVKLLSNKFIAEEMETGQYPRKQAIAIGISRARAEVKKQSARTKRKKTPKHRS